jgi:hypothetical protein
MGCRNEGTLERGKALWGEGRVQSLYQKSKSREMAKGGLSNIGLRNSELENR